jgi:hypothetical protein
VPRRISGFEFRWLLMARLCHGDVKGKPILTRKLIHYIEETVARVRSALQLRRPTACCKGGFAEQTFPDCSRQPRNHLTFLISN